MSNKNIVNIFLYLVVVISLIVAGYTNLYFGVATLIILPVMAIVILYFLEFLEKINIFLPYIFISMFLTYFLFIS